MPAVAQRPSSDRLQWDRLAARPRPSSYLDPLVALQKRRVHQELIRRWIGTRPSGVVLKTDLFEDAWGDDAILHDLFERTGTLLGTDIAAATVHAAAARAPDMDGFACDLLQLPLRPAGIDVLLSTSTLDHFRGRYEFHAALVQLLAAVRPGGQVVITLDNPLNPLYPLLRLASRLGLTPFHLGYTPRPGAFVAELRKQGFEILDTAWLIHNPRLVSTAMFAALRRVFGRRADAPVGALLNFFALQAHLPSRRFSACFHAVHARRIEA